MRSAPATNPTIVAKKKKFGLNPQNVHPWQMVLRGGGLQCRYSPSASENQYPEKPMIAAAATRVATTAAIGCRGRRGARGESSTSSSSAKETPRAHPAPGGTGPTARPGDALNDESGSTVHDRENGHGRDVAVLARTPGAEGRRVISAGRSASPMRRSGVPRPATRTFTLANGLNVVLAPSPASPVASVWVWYRVGSKNEHPGITGASHWVEHMLFQGSPRYGKGEIDRAVVRVGGELNAFTDTDFTAYFTTVPHEHLAVPLDIESDRMTRALITDGEVERERTVIHSEREGNENWPEFRVEEELYQLAFRIHPYRWDALGRREDIERMSPAQLREYYQRYYGTRNATLVIAGKFNPAATAAEVRRRFSPLPRSGAPVEVAETEPFPRGERRAELSGPGTTPYLQLGWRAPAFSAPETAATMALDSLLGGEARLFAAGSMWGRGAEHPSARLYRALVDPGLAVRATSDWRPRTYEGLFTIQAQAARGVSLDRLEAAIDAVLERLRRTGPTAAEMDDLRTKVRRGVALAYEGASRTAFRLGYFSVLGGPALEDALFRQLLRVRAREIRDRARAMFVPEARVVVRYEPTEAAGDE